MGKKEERVHSSCFSDRSHFIVPDISNSHAYQKTFQEQMMHEYNVHDTHVPALVTSTRVKLNNVADNGCLYFGDHDFADDDAADDEAYVALKCENADAAGSDGDEGLGDERGNVPTGRSDGS